MASVSLKLVLLISACLLLGDTSAQELYDDEANLEQYSPMLGENFIDYPIIEEYGIPTVEEFPTEDDDDDDDDDDDVNGEEQEEDTNETEQKAKKGEIKHQDKEHAQKTSSALKTKSDAREKRQLPLQDDPEVIAREKLQRAIKAAQALTNIEKKLGLGPSTIESKTTKLEKQLKDEEKNFQKLADQTEDKEKKQKFVKLEKVADEDVSEAESILKFIVKLEAAKYLAKERAQEELETAQKNKIAANPQMFLGAPLTFPPQPQAAGYFGGMSQPAYQPVMPSYTTSYPPQMFQGMGPASMASAPSSLLSPASLPGPAPSQPNLQDNAELQRINAINTDTSVSAFSPQSSAQHGVESVKPEAAKVSSYTSEGDNNDINPGDVEFSDMESPSLAKKPAVQQATESAAKAQSDAKAKAPQASASETKPAAKPVKPAQTATPAQTIAPSQPVAPAQQPAPVQPVTPAQAFAPVQPVTPAQAFAPVQPVTPIQPVAPAQPVAPVQPVTPARPVAPAQPVSLPVQTIESAVGQSNGFMSQSAPLTVSYNPAVTAPDSASMSRYFDSPSNSPNMFAPQPYYQPQPKLQTPLQNFVPKPQPKKPAALLKKPAPAKPAVTPYAPFNDQPQILTPASPVNLQPPNSAAYSSEQALSGAYPSSSFYSWNTQALPSSSPQYSWQSPMYYPPAVPYQAPVNPLIAEAYRKLHDTQRASLAMSKIEEAIGLSPNSVKHIVDDIERKAKLEASRYEDDMSKEKDEITKVKERLEKNEVADDVKAKKKIQDDEQKLRDDVTKENNAKSEVEKIKKIEKILTIIEAAKYSAMQRAKKRIHKVKADEGIADGDDIRKRDLEDLEKDIRRRRRNEINIWLKGSRNRIDASHFLRNRLGRLGRHREGERSKWNSDKKNHVLDHSDISEKLNKTDDEQKKSKLHKLKFFNTLSSNKKFDSGNQFAVIKRTDVPTKPENPANAVVMAKMLDKMDKLFKIQGEILKYLKTEHTIDRLRQKKRYAKRWRRSLHHSKHHHKKTHKDVKRKKRKAN